jgi:NADH-quinone oxidoreductase subunit M
MTEMHLPWLEAAIGIPLLGAMICRGRVPREAWRISIVAASLTLLAALCAWEDFLTLHTFAAHDHWYFARRWLGDEMLVIDELSAPLLSLSALTYLMTIATTTRVKSSRYSFGAALCSLSLLMATLSSRESWLLVGLLAASVVPVDFDLRRRGEPVRAFRLHLGLFVALLVVGWGLVELSGPSDLAAAVLTLAILIRSGVAPFHCWQTDLFERGGFGAAIQFCTPLVGVYAAMHFVFPIASQDWLRLIAIASMLTALYAAAMTIVQTDIRRFFSYLLLSQVALIMAGLEVSTPEGLAGALAMWLSAGLSLMGLGLVLRAIEARVGRVSLDRCHGLYAQIPGLALFYLLSGLATVGFPGTFGFFASELLLSGTVHAYPQVGLILILATALTGIAIFRSYLLIFAGRRKPTSVSIHSQWRERLCVITLSILLVGGGIYPQPAIVSRFEAAEHLFIERDRGRAARLDERPEPLSTRPVTISVEPDGHRHELSSSNLPQTHRPHRVGDDSSQPPKEL